jgi:16S rRNA C967 or C1407 C5-methylase (RsmB/RsmF family)
MCRSYEAAFDAILLDAPCSSERHVLRQAGALAGSGAAAGSGALAEWSPSRIRGLAIRQWALLSSALIMLKEGGCLVYSTCALSPEENDGVVARAVAKYGESLSFDRPAFTGGGEAEETLYGLSILPDRARGAGPMYLCRMRKRPPAP